MAREKEVPKAATMADMVADLRAKRAEVELGGGKERIAKQHESGKLSARIRKALKRSACTRGIGPLTLAWPIRICRRTEL
jgi:hypothetical protein